MVETSEEPESAPAGRPAKAVLLVGTDPDWPPELLPTLDGDGYRTQRVAELGGVPTALAVGDVRAVFVPARPLGANDLLLLQRARTAWPQTAVVLVTRRPNDPDVKRAFESGATAFLSWPASADAVRHAIDSVGRPART